MGPGWHSNRRTHGCKRGHQRQFLGFPVAYPKLRRDCHCLCIATGPKEPGISDKLAVKDLNSVCMSIAVSVCVHSPCCFLCQVHGKVWAQNLQQTVIFLYGQEIYRRHILCQNFRGARLFSETERASKNYFTNFQDLCRQVSICFCVAFEFDLLFTHCQRDYKHLSCICSELLPIASICFIFTKICMRNQIPGLGW